MESNIVIYIPSDSKVSRQLSMKRILSVPLFLRSILTLAENSNTNFIIVAPRNERRHILKAWKRHTKHKKIIPHFVWTKSNQKIDDYLLTDIINHTAKTITFINANLLISKTALDPWKDIKLKSSQYLAAIVDRGLPPIVRFTKSNLTKIKKDFSESPERLEIMIREILRKTSPHKATKRWNEPAELISKFTAKSSPTKFLTEQIRKNTSAWVARNINKRISLPISIILARLRIHPNTITVFNMLVGMGASIGAAGRTYVGLLIGAILFQAASIIDGCDGEVAKLTHRASKFGEYIDSISDNFALAGFITGLMIHEYRVNNHTPLAFVWGGLLLIGFFIILLIMIRFLKKNTNSASFATFDKEYLAKLPQTYPKPVLVFIKYGKYTLKKDFFSFVFLVFAILGILPVMFYLAVVGVWIGVFLLSYLNLKAPKKDDIVITKRTKKCVIETRYK